MDHVSDQSAPVPDQGGDQQPSAVESSADERSPFDLLASAVRFYWTEAGIETDRNWYHWSIDCPWILVATWHGGRLVTSVTPPPEAGDVERTRADLERYFIGKAWDPDLTRSRPPSSCEEKRWLCRACDQFVPRLVAQPETDRAEGSCAACGCDRRFHDEVRAPFDNGCGMAWLDGVFDDGDPDRCIGLIHCPCDGYQLPGTPPLPSGPSPETGSDGRHRWCMYREGERRRREGASSRARQAADSRLADARLLALPDRPDGRPPECVSDDHARQWYRRWDQSRGCRICHPNPFDP